MSIRITKEMLRDLAPEEKMLVWAKSENDFRLLCKKVKSLGNGRFTIHRPILIANLAFIKRNSNHS